MPVESAINDFFGHRDNPFAIRIQRVVQSHGAGRFAHLLAPRRINENAEPVCQRSRRRNPSPAPGAQSRRLSPHYIGRGRKLASSNPAKSARIIEIAVARDFARPAQGDNAPRRATCYPRK
jgi:hypothetical protein